MFDTLTRDLLQEDAVSKDILHQNVFKRAADATYEHLAFSRTMNRIVDLQRRMRAENPVDIKRLRQVFTLNQRRFAERFDIPLSTLKKWESGASGPGRMSTKHIGQIVGKLSPRQIARYFGEKEDGLDTIGKE